ncbi:hypothetical protein REIP_0426 [Rickettsia endosymbiont of Ixodes pacificus]|uniref:hypothetical protein n=1 Tax=Rickettsia endosymbiont of Ixodes pacificus TaxID=1133329 RepID=UPI00061EF29A|nr:hypothetical protein [Rickettsia endosymbiont of Ixodes pacificus]KJW02418.1 hypothetical protein REIP_0426 [Rickettsia endosymbiont of Ixodes pacificus]
MLDDARTYDKSTKDYNLGSAHFITTSGYKALLGAYKALNPEKIQIKIRPFYRWLR